MTTPKVWRLKHIPELELAAQAGNSDAQLQIARLLLKRSELESGMPDDAEKAILWLRKAVEAGNESAQIRLGHCYKHGQGVDKSLAEAARWFKLAAERGNGSAQILIGQCHEFGQGVEENRDEATKWYQLAAMQRGVCGEHASKWLREAGKQVPLLTIASPQGTHAFQVAPNHTGTEPPAFATPSDKHVQAQPKPHVASIPKRNADRKIKITIGRCIASGMWAGILCAGAVHIGGLWLLVAVPLLGLPWLMFEMDDRSINKESFGAAEGIMTLFAGAFLSLLCAIPIIAVIAILKRVFW